LISDCYYDIYISVEGYFLGYKQTPTESVSPG
jgi:hypothetical protein